MVLHELYGKNRKWRTIISNYCMKFSEYQSLWLNTQFTIRIFILKDWQNAPPPLKSHYHSVIWRLYYKVVVILNILTLLMKMIDLKLNRHMCICTAFRFFFTVTLQFSLRIQFYWLVGWNWNINIEKWVIVLTQKKTANYTNVPWPEDNNLQK